MSHSQNVGSMFLAAAHQNPQAVALLDEERAVSFMQMAALIQNFSLHFQLHGVGAESTVTIKSTDPSVVIASVFATSLLGCRWVYASKHLLENSPIEVSHYLETDRTGDSIHPDVILITDEWSRRPKGFELMESVVFAGFRDENEPWMILPSSGTTGTPKLMAFSNRNLFDRIEATAPEFASGPSRCVFLFALHSPPALIRALSALISGWGLVVSTDPQFWHSSNVSHVFGSPLQISKLLRDISLPKKMQKVLVGGGDLPNDLSKDLFNNFEVVVNTYGSTEANLVLENAKSISPEGDVLTTTIHHDSTLQIVDENDVELPQDQDGIVRIKNDYLAPGYLNNPAAEAATFRKGWFYPGDRGLWTTDGNFSISGRVDDLFNLGGTKINAILLDYILMSIEGIRDAVCFIMPEENNLGRLMAFLELESSHQGRQGIIEAAKLKILSELGPNAMPERFMYTETIPRTENGKPNRKACVDIALRARKDREK